MTKTIKQWGAHLPAKVRSKFIRNCIISGAYDSSIQFDSLTEALDRAFYWGNTPEERPYWSRVHSRCRLMEQHPRFNGSYAAKRYFRATGRPPGRPKKVHVPELYIPEPEAVEVIDWD